MSNLTVYVERVEFALKLIIVCAIAALAVSHFKQMRNEDTTMPPVPAVDAIYLGTLGSVAVGVIFLL